MCRINTYTISAQDSPLVFANNLQEKEFNHSIVAKPLSIAILMYFIHDFVEYINLGYKAKKNEVEYRLAIYDMYPNISSVVEF